MKSSRIWVHLDDVDDVAVTAQSSSWEVKHEQKYILVINIGILDSQVCIVPICVTEKKMVGGGTKAKKRKRVNNLEHHVGQQGESTIK